MNHNINMNKKNNIKIEDKLINLEKQNNDIIKIKKNVEGYFLNKSNLHSYEIEEPSDESLYNNLLILKNNYKKIENILIELNDKNMDEKIIKINEERLQILYKSFLNYIIDTIDKFIENNNDYFEINDNLNKVYNNFKYLFTIRRLYK